MRAMSVLAVIFASAILSGTGGCVIDIDDFSFDSSDFRHRFHDYFEADLQGIERVVITIPRGGVLVSTWSEPRIEIGVEERIKALDRARAGEIADEVRLGGHRIGKELRIDVDYGEVYHLRRYYMCSLDIDMPADIEVSIETTHGGINLERMERGVTVSSTHGGITLEGCGGDADLSSTHGSIEIGPVSGTLFAESTHGAIVIRGAADNVTARTSHGTIEIELESSEGFSIDASTTHAVISDTLPDDLFEAGYNRRHTSLRGRYRDGSHRVSLKTTHGRISISAR